MRCERAWSDADLSATRAVDAALHRLMVEVTQLKRSSDAYREPALAARIAREMQAG